MTDRSFLPQTPEASDSLAERLCRTCGLCCNGVLFHLVRLQTGDLLSELASLGLKIRRKKGSDQFSQPCPALESCQCTIYSQRPTRCRRFECQQLQGAVEGKITEEAALMQIQGVQQKVRQIESLMETLGKSDPKRPLTKRYEKIIAESVELIGEERIPRMELEREMQELQQILDRDFRVINQDAPGEV